MLFSIYKTIKKLVLLLYCNNHAFAEIEWMLHNQFIIPFMWLFNKRHKNQFLLIKSCIWFLCKTNLARLSLGGGCSIPR